MKRLPLGCFLWALATLVWAQTPAKPEKPQTPVKQTKPQTPATPDKTQPIVDPVAQRWIGLLGDTDFRKRDEAAKALEQMGEKALPALRAARKHSDAEIRRRANELATSLEVATLLAPCSITLEIKQKSAREVAAELARVTGYKVECWGGTEDAKYDFSWKGVPFWQAVEQFCQGAGLTVQPSYGDDRLRLQAQQRYAPYVCRDGAFRAVAGSFQHSRGIDFTTRALTGSEARRTDTVSFSFTVHSEPRLPLLGISDVKLTAAYDDQGQSLILPAEGTGENGNGPGMQQRVTRYYGGGKTLSVPAEVPLAKPSVRARTASLLRGTALVNVLVQQRPETVSDKLAKGIKTKVGTTTFVVEDVTETPTKQHQVKLSLTEENAGTDYTWTNSLHSRIEMYDEKGVRLNNYSSGWSHSSPGHVQITFTYNNNGGKPTKLVYHVWNSIQHQVGFEFKDLPLP